LSFYSCKLPLSEQEYTGKGLIFEFVANQLRLTYVDVDRRWDLTYEVAPFLSFYRDVESLFDLLEKSFSREELSHLQRSHLLKALLAQVVHYSQKEVEDYTGNSDRRYFKLIGDYIKENNHTQILQPTIAEILGLSVQHLNRISHRMCGLSLQNYMFLCKMEWARRLLRKEKLSNKELARRGGYKSANYFGQAFKKHFGLSPLRFRKIHFSYDTAYKEQCIYHQTVGFETLLPQADAPRSLEESKAQILLMCNCFEETLECFWLDSQGQEDSVAKVLAGERQAIYTFKAQTFIIRSLDGSLFGSYVIPDRKTLIVLHREAKVTLVV